MAGAGTPFWRTLYFQVLVGIALGVLVGWLFPEFGRALKPLGDAFIKLVKMIITPVIFLTVVTGIAGMADLKAFGRVGAVDLKPLHASFAGKGGELTEEESDALRIEGRSKVPA